MSEPKILLGSTQTLRCYVQVDVGAGVVLRAQPSAATVRIGTPAVAMGDDDSAVVADRDTLSTDLTADAAKGVVQYFVNEATFAKGRELLLTTPTGEQATVKSMTSGLSDLLDIAEPVDFIARTGSTLQGFSVSKALSSAQTAQPGNGLAMWRVTIDGEDYPIAQPFRVVRRMAVQMLTESELMTSWNVVKQLKSRQDISLGEIMTAAWEHRVLPWLEAQNIAEENVVSSAALVPLHAIGCVLQLADGAQQVGPELAERLQKRWDQCAAQTLARKTWYVTEQLETPPPRPDAPAKPRSGPALVR